MNKPENPWRVPVTVDDIPETGLHLDLSAPAEVRPAVAALAGLRDLPELSANLDLIRRSAGMHVTGRMQATVGQTCVVTLDPIENRVEEAIDVVFMPDADKWARNGGSTADEDAAEPPEPLIGGHVDLGALLVEFLVLGIDPYPRKQGVEFTAPHAEESRNRPFAGLDVLKKQLGGGSA